MRLNIKLMLLLLLLPTPALATSSSSLLYRSTTLQMVFRNKADVAWPCSRAHSTRRANAS